MIAFSISVDLYFDFIGSLVFRLRVLAFYRWRTMFYSDCMKLGL